MHIRPASIVCSVLALAAASCGKDGKHAAPQPENNAAISRRAPDQVKDSFRGVLPAPERGDKAATPEAGNKAMRLSIAEGSLGKEFLLQASMSYQAGLPTGNGLRSMVVEFVERGGTLHMLESSTGNVMGDTFESRNLLASFDIIERKDGRIVFDFDKGMSQLFVAADWYASDFQGGSYVPNYSAVKVRGSFLESVEFDDRNRFVVRQIVQSETQGAGLVDLSSLEVKYYLEPYRPNPAFSPKKDTQDLSTFGYFQANPILGPGGEDLVHASKFDISKGITFAISDNTPAEVHGAIRDGILYWNRAFGREVIKVIDAPKGVRAPDADLNVVQWVDADPFWGAYADAQMDPRTGENLHAQVYLFSGSLLWGRDDALALLRRTPTERGTRVAQQPRQWGLKGFMGGVGCGRELTQEYGASLGTLLEKGSSDAVMRQVSLDFIRELTAHEIGHTLGLRHNFAGSLHANTSLSERDAAVDSYLASGAAPSEVVPSSSVMDYLLIEDSALIGDSMEREAGKALDYDAKSIRHLYFEESFERAQVPPFCTDTMASQWVDCLRYDSGNSLAAWTGRVVPRTGEALARTFLDAFIFAKTPLFGPTRRVEEVKLDGRAMAEWAYEPAFGLAKLFSSALDTSLLTVRAFPQVSELNAGEVRVHQSSRLVGELKANPAAHDLLFVVPGKELIEDSVEALDTMLSSDRYARGRVGTGAAFSFSDEEKAYLKKIAPVFFGQFREGLIAAQVKAVSGKPSVLESIFVELGLVNPTAATFADVASSKLAATSAAAMAETLLLSKGGETIEVELELPSEPDEAGATSGTSGPEDSAPKKKKVKLPVFEFGHDVRAAAVATFKTAEGTHRGLETPWAYSERRALKAKFETFLKQTLGADITTLVPEKVEDARAAFWIEQNTELFNAL